LIWKLIAESFDEYSGAGFSPPLSLKKTFEKITEEGMNFSAVW
jgi:hypothetical protein